eukprot:gene5463-5863_t
MEISFAFIITLLVVALATVGAFKFSTGKVGKSGQVSMLAVGEAAPDFELKNFQGKSFKLSSFKGKQPVVVFFYPADSTPGCTKEACEFQRKSPEFKKIGAEVFGISSGGKADKEKFIQNNGLNSIELLIDEGDKVRTAWKVPRALFGALPGRVTYVIGKDGLIKFIYDDLTGATNHVAKAFEALSSK